MKLVRWDAKTKAFLFMGLMSIAGWASAQTTPAPTPTLTWEQDIQPIVLENCGTCHASTEASGGLVLETKEQVLKVKSSIISSVTQGIMPLGDPEFSSSEQGKKLLDWLAAQPDPLPYYDSTIRPIITSNCLKCHTKGKARGGYAFDTQAQVEAARKIIASEVSRGSMPQGNRTFKNSPEAKVLLDWIKSLDTAP